jgi:beta-phosphoglucomutase
MQRGVIFDMDGVLVDSGAAHRESWEQIAAEIDKPITRDAFDRTFGRSSRDIIRILFGVEAPERIIALDDRKEAIYRAIVTRSMPAMPGAADLVRELHGAGFRLAIGSSGPPENIALVVQALGIESMIAAIVTGFDVQRGKPDPEVFLLAAQRLGVGPRGCLVVEDAPSGIEAAHHGGMKVIAITSSHPRNDLASADLIVDALTEVSAERVTCMLTGSNSGSASGCPRP